MSAKQIGQRILSLRSDIPQNTLRDEEISDSAWESIVDVQMKLKECGIFIDEKRSSTITYVKSTARSIKRRYGLDMIIVDYLGLMTGKGENRAQEIGSISRGLKAIAKELGVSVIALAQLNRGVEGEKRKPNLSDLRDSGEIEQDADIVAMLHRTKQSDSNNPTSIIEVLVRKNRNGPIGEFVIDLHAPTGRISPSKHLIEDIPVVSTFELKLRKR
jgi:replicative DNA helicase